MANFTHGCDLIKSVNGDYAFHIEFTLLFVLFPLYKTGESLLDVISGKTVKEGLKEEKQRNCHLMTSTTRLVNTSLTGKVLLG